MSQALVQKKTTIQKYQKEFAKALPSMIDPERFVRVAITQFSRNPALINCSEQSLVKCLLESAQMGLEVDGRVAHLIPFGKECTLIVDYKGLAELAMRSNLVSFIHADVICENDVFIEDKGQVIQHTIDRRKERGDAYAVYTFVKMKDGGKSCNVMSLHEVNEIRDKFSIGYKNAIKKGKKNNPWQTRPNEMS